MLINQSNRGFNKRFFPRSRFGDIDQKVIAWRTTVLNNGGSAPSMNTMKALDWFYKSLRRTSIFNKIKSLNCFVPDNLVACRVPLIANYGLPMWTNHVFTNSDVTVDGIKGNGSSTYLQTGVIPATDLSLGSAGLTLYSMSDVGEDKAECDANLGTPNDQFGFNGVKRTNSKAYFVCFRQDANGSINPANTDGSGYFSGNRISSTACSIYTAKERRTHTNLGSIAATSGALVNYELYVFGSNLTGSPQAGNYSARRLSFLAIHDGLTLEESMVFFQIIQTFRKKIGGGFV